MVGFVSWRLGPVVVAIVLLAALLAHLHLVGPSQVSYFLVVLAVRLVQIVPETGFEPNLVRYCRRSARLSNFPLQPGQKVDAQFVAAASEESSDCFAAGRLDQILWSAAEHRQ